MLGIIQNEVQKELVTVVLFAILLSLQSFAGVALVRLPKSAGGLLLVVLAALAFDSILGQLVILGILAKPFAQSKHSLIICKTNLGKMRAEFAHSKDFRYMQKFVKSWSHVKIQFGSINYLDEQTPLNCINFANNLTLQLLLITSNKS